MVVLTDHGKPGKPTSTHEEGQPDFLTAKYPKDANSELLSREQIQACMTLARKNRCQSSTCESPTRNKPSPNP